MRVLCSSHLASTDWIQPEVGTWQRQLALTLQAATPGSTPYGCLHPDSPVNGQLGDGPVEDFIAEAERIIEAYDLEGQLAMELLLKHLDGQARREVLAQAPAARAIAGVVLGLLREAFGDHRQLTQLVTAFHCRQQRPAETVLEFSHSLQVLAARITSRDPEALSDRSLRDRFCEVLGETALKRELRGMAREPPDVTLAVLRREESPVDTAVHVQQQQLMQAPQHGAAEEPDGGHD